MEFLTTVQAAKKWGVTPGRVNKLAREGRIPGTVQIGTRWMIPENAKKPQDSRFHAVKEARKQSGGVFRFPGFEHREPEHFFPPLSPEELQIKGVMESFHACRFEEAERRLSDLPERTQNKTVRIYGLFLAVMIAFSQNRVQSFYEFYGRLSAELQGDFPHKKELSSLIHEVNSVIGFTGYFSNTFTVDADYPYAESYRLHLAKLCIFARNYSATPVKSAKDLAPLELLCSLFEEKGSFVDVQDMHLNLGILYGNAKDNKKMHLHFKKALALAEQHELYYQVAVTYYYYRETMHPLILDFPEPFRKHVKILSEQIHKNYGAFMNAASLSSIFCLLESKEYLYVFYAVQGHTGKEVAKMLGVSEVTVSNRYNAIYQRLGICGKQELVELYKKTVSGSLS